jgi:geranylgeranyl diphosphate synthase type II
MIEITSEINRLQLEENLQKYISYDNPTELTLEWGINHIFYAPSKRIRPLLVLESNLVFSDLDEDSYLLAAAVEAIHTYSLIHDDLPCMDDDDLRRGVKTLHTIKDAAYGVLVGDALLTEGLGILSGYSKPERLPELLKLFLEKAGRNGMVGGQYLDMEGEGTELDADQIDSINALKTGALIELSLLCGAINAGADTADLPIIGRLGTLLGRIFQLQDDILDIIGDTKKLGKKTGSDQKKKKSSIPLVTGMDKARSLMDEYAAKAGELIDSLPDNRRFFHDLVQFLLSRTS